MLGASGAVAGVLGAYLVLFPRARVVALVPFLVFIEVMEIPAGVFLLIWLVFQNLVPAAATLPRRAGEAGGGVAYWAHIGGFLCGAAIAWLFRARLRGGGEVRRRPPHSRRIWVVYRR
jgi:membrane associated rhomboid family serine protease